MIWKRDHILCPTPCTQHLLKERIENRPYISLIVRAVCCEMGEYKVCSKGLLNAVQKCEILKSMKLITSRDKVNLFIEGQLIWLWCKQKKKKRRWLFKNAVFKPVSSQILNYRLQLTAMAMTIGNFILD